MSIILTIAAVTVAATAVRRELLPSQTRNAPERDPVYVDNWEEVASDGVLIAGPDNAPIQVIEFSDLECPFCARFHETVVRDIAAGEFPGVALRLLHFPLSMHRFAIPAARAAECAGEQGMFAEYVQSIFMKQDSLGLKSWSAYAESVRIPDAVAFTKCLERDGEHPRILAGQRWSQELALTGTPTVLVNGWRLFKPPTVEELVDIIAKIQAGKPLALGATRETRR